MRLLDKALTDEVYDKILEAYEDYANKGEYVDFPQNPSEEERISVLRNYQRRFKVGTRVNIPGEGSGTVMLFDKTVKPFGRITVALDDNADRTQIIRLGIDKVEVLKEGTIYKWDSARGYGYFTSDGKGNKEEESKEEEPKREVDRNDYPNDEELFADMQPGDTATLGDGYTLTKTSDGGFQISSSHPYDMTDYSFAKSSDGIKWVIVEPEERTIDNQHIVRPAKKYNIEIHPYNPAIYEDDLNVILAKMKEIDSTKESRIDKS